MLIALGALLECTRQIGQNCFPKSPHLLFAHQTGDGLAIVSEFGAESWDVPIALAIILLRIVSGTGRFGKATIAEDRAGPRRLDRDRDLISGIF